MLQRSQHEPLPLGPSPTLDGPLPPQRETVIWRGPTCRPHHPKYLMSAMPTQTTPVSIRELEQSGKVPSPRRFRWRNKHHVGPGLCGTRGFVPKPLTCSYLPLAMAKKEANISKLNKKPTRLLHTSALLISHSRPLRVSSRAPCL